MDSRQYVMAARVDPARAKDQVLELLPWLQARSLLEFLPHIPRQVSGAQYHVDLIRTACHDFHRRAGTLSAEIENKIKRISENNLVRLSHQPNLLAYMKLIGQFIALDEMANRVEGSVPLFYFIDYDITANRRFRQVEIPDPLARFGLSRIQLPGRSQRTAIANVAKLPNREWLNTQATLLRKLAQSYEQLGFADGPIEPRLRTLLDDLEFAFGAARNVAEFGAILISRYVNLWLQIPIPFLAGSVLWADVAQEAVQREMRRMAEIRGAIARAEQIAASCGITLSSHESENDTLPWWKICHCGSRMALRMSDPLNVLGACPHCHHSYSVRVGSDAWRSDLLQSSPRILFHSLLNTSSFGYKTGVSHIGSAEHIILHSLALTLLGRAPLPQWLWECKGPFSTVLEEMISSESHAIAQARSLIQTGNSSFIYFALCVSPEKLNRTVREKVLSATTDTDIE